MTNEHMTKVKTMKNISKISVYDNYFLLHIKNNEERVYVAKNLFCTNIDEVIEYINEETKKEDIEQDLKYLETKLLNNIENIKKIKKEIEYKKQLFENL